MSNLITKKITLIVLGLLVSQPTTAQEGDILDFLPAIIASHKPLPKPINFKVLLPITSNDSEYVIDLNHFDIPSNRSEPVKTTNNLQAAINWASEQGYGRIIVPNGHYLIGRYGNSVYQAGISLPANTEFVLSPNTVIEMDTNDKWNYCILAVRNKQNVTIRGGTLKGDKATHIFTPRAGGGIAHDEGHGICLESKSQRILIHDMQIHSTTGDGVLIVNSGNITIRNNNIHSNRRQGVSIVGGKRINIEQNEIHHIRGTSPQFGVDIEGVKREDKDIIIQKNNFHHNRGGDVVNTNGENVFIIKNTMSQGRKGKNYRYIDGPIVTWNRTDNVIAQNKITMLDGSVNGFLGYIQYSSGKPKGHNRMTYVWDNKCTNCGMYMYKSADADIRRNQFLGYFLALVDFKNATVIDNHTSIHPDRRFYCWLYRFRNVTGTASGNTFSNEYVSPPTINKSFPLPLSNTPWTSKCLRR